MEGYPTSLLRALVIFPIFVFFWKYDLEDSITASWKQGIIKNEQSREVALRDLQVDDCMWYFGVVSVVVFAPPIYFSPADVAVFVLETWLEFQL